MERKKSALTPENYIRAIISLSKRYSSTSAFPGNNYVDLREWLLQDRGLLSPAKPDQDAVLFDSKSKHPHDLVVVYNSDEKKWGMQHYRQEQYNTFAGSTSPPVGGSGQLVFVRGFISPAWVAVLGSKYNIDPEFFRRHMDFLSASIDRHAYSSPSLSSSSDNIFRLCVSTIFHRDDFGGQNLQSQRKAQTSELEKYKIQQLGSTRVCCGDSVVREYSAVCPSFSVVEQWISLCLAKTERGWTVIAWMDQGRPLEESPPGPWTIHINSKATPLPVIQHHHKMAFRTTTNRLDPDTNASAEVQQSTAVIPLQYDSLLALVDLARRAPHDPMSMCLPLFAHSAFSEVQFLNLMESRIQMQMAAIAEGVPDDALGTLQYFTDILDRHAKQLQDSRRALGKLIESSGQAWNDGKRQAPEVEAARSARTGGSNGAFTTNGLSEDYEQLHVRCIGLSQMCSRGITLAMNKATIEESRKAIEQSERLKKLTVLATLFIPLSFCTSLFGMNIDLLGQSTVTFWWFFVFCIPITLSAYVVYLWDFQALNRSWVRLWRRCRSARRGTTGGKGEKEAIHIV
ncbi:putative CorA metal ion transporter [Seiridium cardinale]|uniref:CorA metal ion transporter n=1 Tax=Seiridium cardinale TaxID=138064 RepID=A0ABR2XLA9_9PEZI